MRRSLVVLFILTALLISPGAAQAAKKIALVIGNDAYENISKLGKAVGDAQAMAKKLADMGFTVVVAENADRNTMSGKLFEFTSQIEQNDVAVFFFAGHGVRINNTNYLLPTDIPKPPDRGAELVADAAFAANRIRDRIRKRAPLVNIMVLDACRNNPFPVADGPGTRTVVGETRGLARMVAPKGTFILFSAGEGERALDGLGAGDDHPNSVFTRNLVEMIDTPGLSLTRMAKKLQARVYRQARKISHEQAPAYYDRILDEYCLVPGKDGTCGAATVAAPPPRPSAPPVTPTKPPSPDQAMIRKGNLAYGRAKRSKDRMAALESFLGAFPDHPKAPEAEKILEGLTESKNCSEALRKGTVEAYSEYLLLHPKGSCASDIRHKRDNTFNRKEKELEAKKERLRKQEEELDRLRRLREEEEQRERENAERQRRQQEQETARLRTLQEEEARRRQQPSKSFRIYQGYDLFGGDYGGPLKNLTYESCLSACRNDPQCQAFTFDRRNNWCFRKNRVPTMKPYGNAVSGVVSTQSQSQPPVAQPARPTGMCGGGFTTFDNVDFLYNDISGHKASFGGCRDRCLRTRGCVGFSWVKKSVAKRCWLKHSMNNGSTNYQVVSCKR